MKRLVVLFPILIVINFQSNAVSANSPDDILVIVNRTINIDKVSDSELRDIFLKKKQNWSSGDRAVPLHSKNLTLKADFCKRLLKMEIEEEAFFWQRYQVKTGKPGPPSTVNTFKAVYKLKGAVSYIYRSQYKEGIVKIVRVLAAE